MESNRLDRIEELFERAVKLFDGNRASATQWMRAANPALSGNSPLVTARTEVGALEVDTLLTQLEHGVFA
jgi:putative toxin-antitoxin system antitoxin component (TIGR02293 family)